MELKTSTLSSSADDCTKALQAALLFNTIEKRAFVLIKFARLLKYFTITELNARWRRRRIRRRLFFAPSSSFQKVLLLCLVLLSPRG